MQDASSTDVKRRRGQRRLEKTPWVETIGGELRVWRDQGTNEIVIEPPVVAPAKEVRRAHHSLSEGRASPGKFAPPFRCRNGIESGRNW